MDILIYVIFGGILAFIGHNLFGRYKVHKISKDIQERRKNIKLAEDLTHKEEKEAESAKRIFDRAMEAYRNRYHRDKSSSDKSE